MLTYLPNVNTKWEPSPPTFGSLVGHVRKLYCVKLFVNLLPFSYNASAHKDQNQNWYVIGYVKVQKLSFHR